MIISTVIDHKSQSKHDIFQNNKCLNKLKPTLPGTIRLTNLLIILVPEQSTIELSYVCIAQPRYVHTCANHTTSYFFICSDENRSAKNVVTIQQRLTLLNTQRLVNTIQKADDELQINDNLHIEVYRIEPRVPQPKDKWQTFVRPSHNRYQTQYIFAA